VKLDHLGGIFNREKSTTQSTEFSFSRFLVPYLCDFEGWALFIDNDIIFRDDIEKLWALRDDRFAVMCVKHDYKPKLTTKFLGEPQSSYEKKNWSSVMLINCSLCQALSPKYVNSASGLDLHQFRWLESEELVGALPKEWNFLAAGDAFNPGAKIVHFTEGGPYFSATRNVAFSEEWFENFRLACGCVDSSYEELAREASRKNK